MRHWHLAHADDGEAFICTNDDQTPLDVGYSDAWTASEIDRAPQPFDRFEGGALVEDVEAKAKAESRSALVALGPVGLIEIIEDLTARIETIEADTTAARRSK